MAIPARRRGAALPRELENADLREPLRDEVVLLEVPRAGDDARELVVKLDVELAGGARRIASGRSTRTTL